MPTPTPVGFPHPLIDESGAWWATTVSRAPTVGLNSGRSAFFVDCIDAFVRPIVVTTPGARLTMPLFHALQLARGAWICRDSDGSLRDGGTGASVLSFASLVDGSLVGGEIEYGLARVGSADSGHTAWVDSAWVQVSMSVHHPARDETTIGVGLERLATALSPHCELAWSSAEPMSVAWDRTAITGLARERMPRDTRLVVAGSGPHPFSGTLRISRSDIGVTEETRAIFAVDDDVALSSEIIWRMLADIADRQQVLIATAWAMRGPADVTIPAFRPMIPQPVAAVIGARAVRTLGLDADYWQSHHGATQVGNVRAPSLAVGFGAESDRWARFAMALQAIGDEGLTSAMLPVGRRARGVDHAS